MKDSPYFLLNIKLFHLVKLVSKINLEEQTTYFVHKFVNKFVHNTERLPLFMHVLLISKGHMTQCGKKAYLPNLSALMSMVVFRHYKRHVFKELMCRQNRK